jgi:hypothetical protein
MSTQEPAVKIKANYLDQPGSTLDAHVGAEVTLINDTDDAVLVVDVAPVAPLAHAYSGSRTLKSPVALAAGETYVESVPVWLTTGPDNAPVVPEFNLVETDVDLDELRKLPPA